MANAPEKVPLMTRLGRQLEKHGLSFGDALNVLLFLLTIVSLIVAILGVIVARITLDEARKAASDQDAQFQRQMEQLTKSSTALERATGDLARQGDLLQKLQGTSDQQLYSLKEQLKDLNAAEARIRARPSPHLTGYCLFTGEGFIGRRDTFVDVSGDAFKPVPFSGGYREYKNSVILSRGKEDEIQCGLEVSNEGKGELKNIELRAFAFQQTENLITTVNQMANSDTFARLISGLNVPPKSSSNRFLNATFAINCGTCLDFTIRLTLEADNFPTTYVETLVTLRERR